MSLPINYVEHEIQSRHYAMTHNWEIVIYPDSDKWPAALTEVLNDLNDKEKNNGASVIRALCQQVSVPNTNVSTVEGNVRGVHFHQIQTRASTPIQTSMVFYEPFDYRLFRFFELWKSLEVNRWDGSQDPECRIHNAVSIALFTHDRESIAIEYPLYNTFCASATISDPQGSGALQQVSVTLQSSNYGIYIPGEMPDDAPYFSQIDTLNGYLGTASLWMSGDGKERTTSVSAVHYF